MHLLLAQHETASNLLLKIINCLLSNNWQQADLEAYWSLEMILGVWKIWLYILKTILNSRFQVLDAMIIKNKGEDNSSSYPTCV